MAIKTTLITLAVVGFVLTAGFVLTRPQRDVENMAKRLHSVSLPLTDIQTKIDSNGIAAAGTAISFKLHKSYPSSFEAKNDIIQHLEAAGVKAPQPSDKPTFAFAQSGITSGGNSPIDNIEVSYSFGRYVFAFLLEQPIPCEYAKVSGWLLCGGEEMNNALTTKLIGSQPINSVSVHASINY